MKKATIEELIGIGFQEYKPNHYYLEQDDKIVEVNLDRNELILDGVVVSKDEKLLTIDKLSKFIYLVC